MFDSDNDNNPFEFDGEDEYALVRRYEYMLRNNLKTFFDIDEFELIIDHYIWENNAADAITAANIADSYFPRGL